MVQLTICSENLTREEILDVEKYISRRFDAIDIWGKDWYKEEIRFNLEWIDYNLYFKNDWMKSPWGYLNIKFFDDEEDEVLKYNEAFKNYVMKCH